MLENTPYHIIAELKSIHVRVAYPRTHYIRSHSPREMASQILNSGDDESVDLCQSVADAEQIVHL